MSWGQRPKVNGHGALTPDPILIPVPKAEHTHPELWTLHTSRCPQPDHHLAQGLVQAVMNQINVLGKEAAALSYGNSNRTQR